MFEEDWHCNCRLQVAFCRVFTFRSEYIPPLCISVNTKKEEALTITEHIPLFNSYFLIQTDMSKCPRCNCEANGQNRLVTDSCGHSKCRLCLLADVSDCLECKLATQSEPSKNKDPPKQQEDNVQASDTRDSSTVNHITTTPEGFHCTVCNKTFRSRTQQYYHRACGNELLKKFPCTQCSRVS